MECINSAISHWYVRGWGWLLRLDEFHTDTKIKQLSPLDTSICFCKDCKTACSIQFEYTKSKFNWIQSGFESTTPFVLPSGTFSKSAWHLTLMMVSGWFLHWSGSDSPVKSSRSNPFKMVCHSELFRFSNCKNIKIAAVKFKYLQSLYSKQHFQLFNCVPYLKISNAIKTFLGSR